MTKSRPRERHIFPPESRFHISTPWCKCQAVKRVNASGTVYVHRDFNEEPWMKASDEAALFTVLMPGVLRQRFERWLRREHLQMSQLRDTQVTVRLADHSAGQDVYLVATRGERGS